MSQFVVTFEVETMLCTTTVHAPDQDHACEEFWKVFDRAGDLDITIMHVEKASR